ncbi:hypothetical protein [Halobacillus salinus]|uniref:hypothetical protein n=1 Tax=Halobacillus salinus TaxID=192814 RepID=UPI0009A72CBF|nr:hypothetical protein [Halobacillus salinus]
MAEQGRLPRESNPMTGERPGFAASWKEEDGTYPETGRANPLPIQAIELQTKLDELKTLIANQQSGTTESHVKDTDVLAAVSALSAKVDATNQRLNETLDMSLTGSTVDIPVSLIGNNMREIVLGQNVLLSPGTSTFTNPAGGADVRDSNELSWAIQSSSQHDYEIALHWKGETLSGNFKIDKMPQTAKNIKSDRFLTYSPFVSFQITNNSLSDQTYNTAFYKYSGIPQYSEEA